MSQQVVSISISPTGSYFFLEYWISFYVSNHLSTMTFILLVYYVLREQYYFYLIKPLNILKIEPFKIRTLGRFWDFVYNSTAA